MGDSEIHSQQHFRALTRQRGKCGRSQCVLYNNLKDFKGGPNWIGGNYGAAKNPITSLQGLPMHIGGNLDIIVNPGEGHYFTRAEVLRTCNVQGEVWSRPEERKFM